MLSVEYIPMHYYDAIIIHFTDDDGYGHNILVDGGDINSPKFCYTDKLKGKIEEIFSKGENIDLWVITHIDNDHIGGLYNFVNDKDYFDAYSDRLKEVWMNYGGKEDYDVQRNDTVGYESGKKLRNILREKNVSVKEGIRAGYKTAKANAAIVVIAPDLDSYKRYIDWWNLKEFEEAVETTDGLVSGKDWDYDKEFSDFDLNQYEEDKEVKNNSSIAFVLTYRHYQMLFAADSCSSILLKGMTELDIMKNDKVKMDLVHIPHHGSSRNSSLKFFAAIECPRYIITGNGENRYKLPDKETIARLKGANPAGCELHFTTQNNKLKEIFMGEQCYCFNVYHEAIFLFE